MNKKAILIIVGITFLTTALFTGTPFEFLDVTIDIIGTFIIMILVTLLFISLFSLAKRMENKVFKWTTLGLLTLLMIPYLLVGIWASLLTFSNYHPMWHDLRVYTNDKNEKIIRQWRETSGSIYDYRDRKIIAEYGALRISVNCKVENLKGNWTEYNIKNNLTTTINFDRK